MALKSGRVGVNPDQVDLHGRVKGLVPDSRFVMKTEAPGYDDILTETEASATYQTQSGMSAYQEKLESGTNIKTVNNTSLLGSGNVSVQETLVSGTNIKTINNTSLLGSGNIDIQGGGGDLSDYVKKTDAPGYNDILTETEASSTYQTQSGMSSYVLKSEATGYNDILTETEASSTYQTQSGMSSYVLKSEASGYNDILTETEASSTYQPKLVSGTSIKTVNSTSLLGSGNVSVQPTLVSGTNIKTVNSTSLLGSGNVSVQPTLVSGTNIKTVNSTSLLGSGNVSVQESLVSGTNIKTVNGNSLLGSGNIPFYLAIDFSNIIATLTNNGTLTATEDGFLIFGMFNSNYGNARVYLNNVSMGFNQNTNQFYCFPMKAGDVLTISNGTTPISCTLYGYVGG